MKLYELTADFAELFDEFENLEDEDSQQAWFDTLDGIEQEFEVKAESIAVYIKELNAESEALKQEEDRLKARRKANDSRINSLETYLKNCMNQIGRTKINAIKASISIRNNAESAQFDNEKDFIKMCMKNGLDDYLRFKEPEINRTAVKEALKAGTKLPGALLGRTQSLIIK